MPPERVTKLGQRTQMINPRRLWVTDIGNSAPAERDGTNIEDSPVVFDRLALCCGLLGSVFSTLRTAVSGRKRTPRYVC